MSTGEEWWVDRVPVGGLTRASERESESVTERMLGGPHVGLSCSVCSFPFVPVRSRSLAGRLAGGVYDKGPFW